MSFSQHTAQALLNYMFGKTSNFDTNPTIHVALSTTAPAEDGTNVTEPVGNAYARVATVAGDWNDATDADPSLLDNLNAITFPQASGSWGTCTHFALYDALTAGNYLGGAALNTSKTPGDGDTPSFSAGELDVTLD